ncbi:hypothetical protein HA052_19750 [Chromobacterium haemolyticum]|uniref:Uncharacterized protein n=1 Tax=Chromobacterium fluminis TaxID=3044269 RepID=A0ABX0L726_9NEIS|nr:hypothetical protein [Chromobacterium haemolyticum]NHR07429.1 hypothetical protein [Chromobacterium haemolyticum]
MNHTKTQHGFASIAFRDRNDAPCRLQKSSLVTEDALWLGVDDAEPKIMACNAAAHGVETTETTGWVPYPLPDAVLLTTGMHLTREQVAQLLPILQHFVDTGELSETGHPL